VFELDDDSVTIWRNQISTLRLTQFGWWSVVRIWLRVIIAVSCSPSLSLAVVFVLILKQQELESVSVRGEFGQRGLRVGSPSVFLPHLRWET